MAGWHLVKQESNEQIPRAVQRGLLVVTDNAEAGRCAPKSRREGSVKGWPRQHQEPNEQDMSWGRGFGVTCSLLSFACVYPYPSPRPLFLGVAPSTR